MFLYDDSKFYLSAPGGVTSDDTSTSDCSTPDVRKVLTIQMFTAWWRDRMFDKNWISAWLQDAEEPVRLGWWSVELGVGLVVLVQPLNDVLHGPFPGSLLCGNPACRLGAAAMDLDDAANSCQSGAVGESVPDSPAERTVTILVLARFLYACALNRITRTGKCVSTFYTQGLFANKCRSMQ